VFIVDEAEDFTWPLENKAWKNKVSVAVLIASETSRRVRRLLFLPFCGGGQREFQSCQSYSRDSEHENTLWSSEPKFDEDFF
jgi:hypothetical protein